MKDNVTIDRDAADEILGMANTGVTLCENILKRQANAQYIVENEFAKWFPYIQQILRPAVYPEHGKEQIADDLEKTLNRVRDAIGPRIDITDADVRHLVNTAGPRAVTALRRRE